MKSKTILKTIPNPDNSISIYHIPIRILPIVQTGLIEAKNAGNDTEKRQQIRLIGNVAATVRQERLPCRE